MPPLDFPCSPPESRFFLCPLIIPRNQARAHIDIKGGLSTCPFSSSRESALFSWEFLFYLFFYKLIYVYMCACACVFLFAHSFPCQTNKKIKISGRVRKWDSVEFRCLSPLRVSAQARAAHIDRQMHITDRQRTAEVKPSLPPSLSSCVCLGVEVSGDKQKTKGQGT